ncbi:NADH-quinone oxidoreductase subunit J [Geobacillus thermoleovorans]|uniref:NADH-quinone oxidoreductase subunit J n=1 Tax=Geobacillus thermopakistaniensis (strain MAS1) TaxID=1408282 RepID=A0A7U9JE42_GEOTM|nr:MULTISPECIES: NADH-quinone oxidoreductase subunit J [Geobacillus]AMV12497.1 NADH:ubiquinone oxidoreductase subunit J [Geobacillus thermoleovorans]ESU73804.1 NADH:ubiquinone oxidoreductase subunit J [Geobacillus sp. MAS1]TRY44362.1 NADH-quinone oxidoreductase subunit J [Geobacillus sp. LEMMJ02]UPT60783.1 NADH-quinone oxidoreductase subunit J [Geobacillus thermoleovorans]WMJ19903.1 NADH-quinone oxidoreductase subunit J [Geobacillus kaustophilus]
MSGTDIAFFLLALTAIAGGVTMLQLTNVVHMVIALVMTFLGIAGLYVLLSAEFVAVVQVLIYSGAITIIMLFAIMLTRHHTDERERQTTGGVWHKAVAALSVIAFGLAVYFGIRQLDFGADGSALAGDNAKAIGKLLYSYYTIPFEIVSVILLVALIGAIVLAKKDGKGAEDE